MHDDVRHLSDFDLCHQCMEGDVAALAELRTLASGTAIAYLVNAGAEPAEGKDLVERLWADLLAVPVEGRSRMAHYNGRCAFQTWFNTVALNKLITKKRKQARWQKLIPARIDGGPDGEVTLPPGTMADPLSDEADSAALIELMRDALDHAFRTCDPEDFVLLQLSHCDELLGRELAVMFGCHPSGITRRLEKAQKHISAETIWKIRQRDPWLELRWEDFLELCRTATPASFGLD